MGSPIQDETPPHFTTAVREYLDATFYKRWFGARLSPIPWPPRSTNLTPFHFSVWGYLERLVYATPVNNLEKKGIKTFLLVFLKVFLAPYIQVTNSVVIKIICHFSK